MSFNIGLSGLNAAGKNLNVTGNNIANVGSTGFKASRAEFADVYATSMFGSGKNTTGSGVLTANISQQFTQGNITSTGNSLDLAINGNGFFVLSDNGSRVYTRNGTFSTDSSGYVVDNAGNNLQGYGVDANGNVINGVVSDLRIDTANQLPRSTTQINQTVALNSTSSVPVNTPFDAGDSQSYNWSTSVDVYDSQGNSHTLSQYFVKDGSNSWAMFVTVDGRNPSDPTSTTPAMASVTFDSSGNLNLVSPSLTQNTDGTYSSDFMVTQDGTISLANGTQTRTITNPDGSTNDVQVNVAGWVPATITDGTTTPATWGSNGSTASATGLELDMRGSTQTNTSFAVTRVDQDGYTTGQLSGLSVAENGNLFATYTNGQSKVIGQTILATFANMQGLTPVGNTNWAESYASGEPAIGTPGSGILGSLASGSLEDSNVDLTAELVNLIVAQRDYQANAKTIETENTVSQTIIQMT
ncbi:flagellar hook protein FlgE [Azomonas macrocytogenes]|uniref:Flagellar hook protein FlgE n=1 Tax=Azomonas macrocytogenes TaxID=69962 RepID=A0A839T7E6_AZOMA|nr:flagellar hook protein FlgE [Azomonas macrocytogenes]MBB3104999.1 flagellar hook protein FlgE [Azomonas macrocytogenes]